MTLNPNSYQNIVYPKHFIMLGIRHVMSILALHAEMQKREKRQREGIQSKKDRGEWDDYGQPKAVGFETFSKEYENVIAGELKPFECMKRLGMEKSTYYRYVNQYNEINIQCQKQEPKKEYCPFEVPVNLCLSKLYILGNSYS